MPTQIEIEAIAFKIYQLIKEGKDVEVFLIVKKEKYEPI
jgi:hypothetical protein